MLRFARWLPLVLAFVLAAAPVRAQDGTPPPAEPPPDSTVVPEARVDQAPARSRTVPPPPPAAAFDTTLALPLVVELRPRAAIDDDQVRMAEIKAAALRNVTLQRSYEARRKAQVDIKKNEVASVKIRVDLAKKEKRAADQKELERTKRRLEGEQRYLERARDLHAAEASLQQAIANAAQARIDEDKLESKMHDLGDLASPVVRASAPTRTAQARLIAAIKTRADKESDRASSERTAADRRKGLLDAYAEMIKL